MLLNDPEAGSVIAHTGGLRKIRFGDPKRNKGKRGGIRAIYYYWHTGTQFWLFTVYDLDDLSNDLKAALEREVKARTTP
ncbi:Toxin HigB-2 [compost metagenome]